MKTPENAGWSPEAPPADAENERILEELREAHATWRDSVSNQRSPFNGAWLRKHGYRPLSRRMADRGEALHFASLAGGDVERDFEKRVIPNRTPKSVVEEFRAAHARWSALPEAERGKFNVKWLSAHANGLLTWIQKQDDTINHFAALAGSEVERDFEKRIVPNRTPESAVEELRAAHARWSALPEAERGKFSARWIRKFGRGVYKWILDRKETLNNYIRRAGGDVERDFEKYEIIRHTPESAVEELRAAHAKWAALPEAERGKFNTAWLQKNAGGVYQWANKNRERIDHFIMRAGGDVERDYELGKSLRTPESAVEELRAAHAKWAALPEAERGKFNTAWLQKNAKGLAAWIQKQDELMEYFIARAGGDVERDFEKRIAPNRTLDSAVEELRAAHAKWAALPEAERGRFSISWLQKNASGLYQWIFKQGDAVDDFVILAGGDVERDFERGKIHHTLDSAVEELRAAHAKWAALPEAERGRFNTAWLQKNAARIQQWIRKHEEGGIDHFVILAGGDVERDFERRGEPTKEDRLMGRLERFTKEAEEGETVISQHFRSLLRAFRGANCVDILFAFRPEFKGLRTDKVKGIIATYLGNFLSVGGALNAQDIDAALEHLSDLTLREGLLRTLKEDCFAFIVEGGRRGEPMGAERAAAYREHVRTEIGHLAHPVFAEMIDEVVSYYESLWSIRRPDRMVSAISEQRDFPDINQRVNIKELQETKRLLIADEMGLGKSASVIMAKEALAVGCAVIIAPSNVIGTWQRYLSDETEGGYFRTGAAPRVCTVEHPRQLENLRAEAYDYILLSQERLNERYVSGLKDVPHGMLVVDEVHKLKSLQGKRAERLLDLTVGMKDDAYTALLSGTPIPNKVEDIAMALKLLYPDRFRSIDDRRLVRTIIRGDILDLRSLLIPRMQMKRLEEGVEMPELTADVLETELGEAEAHAYEVLLEDDELLATEKLQLLRQFALNPNLVDATPSIERSKAKVLSKEIGQAFEQCDKVVVFVNDYVEGIIRGRGSIMDTLRIPAGVEVRMVHGDVAAEERRGIERDVRTAGKRLLLFVSGQTADVGIDYSAADRVIFYNEPWTEYQKRQELGRVYRPGLAHELRSTTMIAKGTIEEGIHQYIEKKYLAIEKLLRGIPVTELERQLLSEDEQNCGPDLSVNSELATYYFSSWDKMLRMFGYIKEIGEEDFKAFLETQGEDYAEGYRLLGSRSYQANANRVVGTVISRMAKAARQTPADLRILDAASGPEMLRRHIAEPYQAGITSMDINPEHFRDASGTHVVGSLLRMPFPEHAFDYLNLSLSLHYTNFAPTRGKLERLKALQEINRVLKIGGRAVLNLIYSYPLRNEGKFERAAAELGFSVVKTYTGEAKNGDQYHSHLITLEKIRNLDPSEDAPELSERMGKEALDGLKFVENEARLKKSRLITTEIELNGRAFDIEMNEQDRAVFVEERTALVEANRLKMRYGGIASIPAATIINKRFARIRIKERYVLFKKLEKGSGAVVVY